MTLTQLVGAVLALILAASTVALNTVSPSPKASFCMTGSAFDKDDPLVEKGMRSPIARQDFIRNSLSFFGASIIISSPSPKSPFAFAEDATLSSLVKQIEEAKTQLKAVPGLIKEEKWDSVRALLIKKPIIDCWNKRQPLLTKFVDALGDAGGDDISALEAKEEAANHLRFLDMAAYNNVFNPIKTEGETGATKELIRSYYEDPTKEYKASIAALDEMIKLAAEIEN